jgi:hypothetical protein
LYIKIWKAHPVLLGLSYLGQQSITSRITRNTRWRKTKQKRHKTQTQQQQQQQHQRKDQPKEDQVEENQGIEDEEFPYTQFLLKQCEFHLKSIQSLNHTITLFFFFTNPH